MTPMNPALPVVIARKRALCSVASDWNPIVPIGARPSHTPEAACFLKCPPDVVLCASLLARRRPLYLFPLSLRASHPSLRGPRLAETVADPSIDATDPPSPRDRRPTSPRAPPSRIPLPAQSILSRFGRAT
ncbi:hypothetical protein POSPLADRAFT_1054421 [Postia placenta MAD-698-R-SB12]|uniref:Uncharacterized protein n=1 Tax=Postia placenta MAD-698-R-SB12 TaxID=670580 RepID=A0A1X6NAP4_9APHY|nr:hypothetical protein POSPLADRAFT_1054421 [Postia placenta MAD-698-R-SB12]OSX65681.1 hypothetical protein POSPLADRAFT_1054421 [Postia placenta MAD-698-R-SB12]